MTRFPRVGRRLSQVLTLAAATALSACASAGVKQEGAVRLADRGQIREIIDSLQAENLSEQLAARGRDDGPRVNIWTDVLYENVDRVTPSFKLSDDAYVAVFNVDRDGRVRVLWPESPEDHGFLRGGKTYKLPAFFPGFSRTASFASFTRTPAFGLVSSQFGSPSGYGYGSYYASPSQLDRYAGYVFVVASWAPLRLERLEELDRWDAYLTGRNQSDFEPYTLTRSYAELLVPRGKRWYTVDYRFYGEESGGRAMALAQCAGNDFATTQYLSSVYFGYKLGRVSMSDLSNAYNAVAMSSCANELTMLYRALILNALNGMNGGLVGLPGGPTIPTTPRGDSTNLGTGGGSLPATPDHPRPGNGHRKADGDDGAADPRATRPPKPKRGETSADDEAVDLDVRATRPGQRRPADTRAEWDAPRATRGEWARANRPRSSSTSSESDDMVRLPAPRERGGARATDTWGRPVYNPAPRDTYTGASRNAEARAARNSGSASSTTTAAPASAPAPAPQPRAETPRTESPRTESPRSPEGGRPRDP